MDIKLVSALLLIAISASTQASKLIDPEVMKAALESDGDVKAIAQLPIETLNLVETKKGNTYFISGNGRFVFKGKLFDVWKNQSVDNVADAKSLDFLKLSDMGITDADMAIFKVGNPNIPRQGYLIVDPTSRNTKEILRTVMNDQGEFHLDILLVPRLKGAKHTVERLWCAENKNTALTDLILQTNTTVKAKENCDKKPIFRNMALFSLLDINSTPIIVREDGYRLTGVPKDLKFFLLNKDVTKNEKK